MLKNLIRLNRMFFCLNYLADPRYKCFSYRLKRSLAITTALIFPLFVFAIYFLIQLKKKARRQREKDARDQERVNLLSGLTKTTETIKEN